MCKKNVFLTFFIGACLGKGRSKKMTKMRIREGRGEQDEEGDSPWTEEKIKKFSNEKAK